MLNPIRPHAGENDAGGEDAVYTRLVTIKPDTDLPHVLREHVGRRHDLQDARVLQECDRVASDVIGADGGPTRADGVKDDQLVK